MPNDRLNAAIASLTKQADAIQKQIETLKAAQALLVGSPPKGPKTAKASAPKPSGKKIPEGYLTVAERALLYIREHGATQAAVLEKKFGTGVRTALMRLVQRNLLTQPGRGIYAEAAKPSPVVFAPTDSSPASSAEEQGA